MVPIVEWALGSLIGQVALLHELPDEMVIPAGVAQKIQRGTKNDVARRWLENEGNTMGAGDECCYTTYINMVVRLS